MSVNVYWTKEAERTFNKNIEYLSETWDTLTINGFLERVDEVILTIKKSPELYPLYNKNDNVHKCVLNRHVSLYVGLLINQE